MVLHSHARGHPEGGGDGGEYGDGDVQDFAPDFFVHFIFERLKVKGERLKVMGCVFTTEDTESHGVFSLPSGW